MATDVFFRNINAMADNSTVQPSSMLLDLPDELLNLIVGYLQAADRRRIMASCRRTACVTLRAAESKLRITKSTKFAGIRKVVLNSNPIALQLEIICPDVSLDPSYAVTVFMGMATVNYSKQAASLSCWEGITKVTIQGTMLRCLVPQYIATACPQLAQLTITKAKRSATVFNTIPEDALPMMSCSNLKQLTFDVCWPKPLMPPEPAYRYMRTTRRALKLPAAHHSTAELLHNLPNVDTLMFEDAPCCVLIHTYAKQLTRLEIGGNTSSVEQSVRMCSKLQHLRISKMVLPDNLYALKVMDLIPCGYMDDSCMSKLLQMPSVFTIRLSSLLILFDWSQNACSWQELHIEHLPSFTSLGNLNLTNIKRFSTGANAVVTLPDQTTPDVHARLLGVPLGFDGMRAVRRAADNLAHAGQIVIEDAATTARGSTEVVGTIRWEVPERCYHNDAATAELLCVAAQRVGPASVCDLGNLLCYPWLLRSVIVWGCTFIESVCLGDNSCPSPSIWQELQHLQVLKTVTMWPWKDTWNLQIKLPRQTPQVYSIIRAVKIAACHYVIPASKSLRLQFGIEHPSGVQKNQDKQQVGLMTELERGVLKDGQAYLQTALKDNLPAGSRLVSVDIITCDQFDKKYSSYDWRFFWSVLVEPREAIPNAINNSDIEMDVTIDVFKALGLRVGL